MEFSDYMVYILCGDQKSDFVQAMDIKLSSKQMSEIKNDPATPTALDATCLV
jgi:hypothetical protein